MVLVEGQLDVGVSGGEEVLPGVGEVGRQEAVVDVVESGGEGGRGGHVGVRVTDQAYNSSCLEGSGNLGVG